MHRYWTSRHRKIQGFTLIEVLLWFMLLAAVVGGVFALSRTTFGVSNAQETANHVVTVATGVKRLTSPPYSDPNGLLADLITAKLAPANIVDRSSSPAVLRNSWGGRIYFGTGGSIFLVVVTDVPPEGCVLLAKTVNGPGFGGARKGLVKVYSGFPPNNTEVANLCGYTGTSTINFEFQ